MSDGFVIDVNVAIFRLLNDWMVRYLQSDLGLGMICSSCSSCLFVCLFDIEAAIVNSNQKRALYLNSLLVLQNFTTVRKAATLF